MRACARVRGSMRVCVTVRARARVWVFVFVYVYSCRYDLYMGMCDIREHFTCVC